ncbi:MAG TPA: undecaprenyl diphosphate synthase family protein [Candidatus Nanoarchaeia archaeon]|nr:undecaprenyl diphosphate synthase family protein [Candidatus Nanoarchaeia archaeon]
MSFLDKQPEMRVKRPRHVAVTIFGTPEWARLQGVPLADALRRKYSRVMEIISLQVALDIPILTFLVSPRRKTLSEEAMLQTDAMKEFFTELSTAPLVHEHQMKVSVLGKWYDLPGSAIEPVKAVIEQSRGYDRFFLNFCVQYDGQEEIVDACRLIARKIKAEKIDVEAIDAELVKENIYASYFLPPDLIITTGRKKRTAGILLWDSKDAMILHTGKRWPEFSPDDFRKAVAQFGQ